MRRYKPEDQHRRHHHWKNSYSNMWIRLRSVDCRLVVVMGWDCRLRTAALGLLFYPWVISMWTWQTRLARANS
jgi:hypothetical protein